MDTKLYTKKPTLLIGCLTFCVLIILSIIFYKERIGTLDSAFHLFEILRQGTPTIQNNRFVALLTQFFPLLGAKFHLPLSSIALMYSVGHVIIQIIIFCVIVEVLKNPKIALAYLLFLTLITTHTFFWVQSELPQGVGFLFIYFALLERILAQQKIRVLQALGSLALMIIIAFAHPLLIFPFLFFHIYHFQKKESKAANKIIVVTVLAYLFIAVARTLIFKASYEITAFAGLNNFAHLFPNYINLSSHQNFLEYLWTDFYFMIVLFGINSFSFLKNKQYFKLVSTSSFFLGYLLLVNVCYYQGVRQFYLENQYLLLAIFVIIPFLQDGHTSLLSKKMNWPILQYLLPLCIVFLFTVRILNTSSYYTSLQNWKRKIITQSSELKDKRIVVFKNEKNEDMILDGWAFPYEVWFISTIEFGYSQAALYRKDPIHFNWTWDKYDKFISDMTAIPYNELAPPYFKFPDTSAETVFTPSY